MEGIETLQRWMDESSRIVFFGGAGVSTESGIPDFRSVDGLYHQQYQYPPETILSRSFFDRQPEEFYRFYRSKMLCLEAKPNAAHKKLAELERECPEDYRAWAEYRGGELRHGAETKAAVGERGRAALEEWSFSAGADTDLYVFSHGSWIAQTVQTVLGLGAIHPDFADVVSMGNAHWVRFVAADMPDGTLRWRLVDYNHGPALADTDQWEHPAL